VISKASSEGECDISGIEIIQMDKIIVCDYSNKKVKLFDTVQNKIVSEINIHGSPYAVAAIMDDTFAVTVPNGRCIHFMTLTNQHIASDRMVNIKKECYGIAYSRDKLVVSCVYPGNVLVLDLQCNILQSFGDDLIWYPFYITVDTTGTSIYICDCQFYSKSIKKLDWHGNVLNKYRLAPGERDLRGICELDDGTFLVCLEKDSDDNVRRISDSCRLCSITINEKFGNWCPTAVTYCKNTRKLYMSYSKAGCFGSLKVFKVNWC
jgi:hypothetical protein